MENNGWIKIHRKILDNPAIMKDADHIAIWLWLLLNVTHKEKKVDFGGSIVSLKPGQITCGRQQLAYACKVNECKVERVLNLFKSEQQIAQQTTNRCRLITINNWIEYQQSEQQNEQQMNNKRTTNEQQMNTKQEVKEIKNERMEEDERGEKKSPPTPRETFLKFIKDVFEKNEEFEKLVNNISIRTGTSSSEISAELDKFVSYWTEKTPNGKKERWQKQEVFEVKRRLVTWFKNFTEAKEKNNKFGQKLRGGTIIS